MSTITTPAHAPITSGTVSSTRASQTTKSIADYERSILNHLRDATKPWLSISKDFLDAKSHLTRPEFEELCKKVGLSYSTARKLIKVAECTRLSNYADRLASIDSWSTLHEIAKLDASSFGEFAAEYLDSANDVRVFKRSDVEKFNAKRNGSSSAFASYFTVKVNASAALSKADEDLLSEAANDLEQALAGKIKLVWHVDKPANAPTSPAVLAA
jgi:hypothetical protein